MRVRFIVYSTAVSQLKNERLFERMVDVNDSVSVPYASVVSVLRFLYPNCIVSMECV